MAGGRWSENRRRVDLAAAAHPLDSASPSARPASVKFNPVAAAAHSPGMIPSANVVISSAAPDDDDDPAGGFAGRGSSRRPACDAARLPRASNATARARPSGSSRASVPTRMATSTTAGRSARSAPKTASDSTAAADAIASRHAATPSSSPASRRRAAASTHAASTRGRRSATIRKSPRRCKASAVFPSARAAETATASDGSSRRAAAKRATSAAWWSFMCAPMDSTRLPRRSMAASRCVACVDFAASLSAGRSSLQGDPSVAECRATTSAACTSARSSARSSVRESAARVPDLVAALTSSPSALQCLSAAAERSTAARWRVAALARPSETSAETSAGTHDGESTYVWTVRSASTRGSGAPGCAWVTPGDARIASARGKSIRGPHAPLSCVAARLGTSNGR